MVLANLGQLKGALSVIAMKSTQKRVVNARYKLCQTILRDTNNFVPYSTGELASSAKILPNGLGVSYTADYAEYVNNAPEGIQFNKLFHSQATSEWLDVSILANREKWLREFSTMIGGK